jgi:hypothetical protein
MKPGIKRRPEKLMMRVAKGCIQPADNYTAERLRARGYRVGDIVAAVLTKPRSPGFHRLAHQLGGMVAANIDAFHGLQAHSVLKRIQMEARIGCDEISHRLKGYGDIVTVFPRSLSFESMDDGEFHEIMTGFCRHIAAEYWPSLTPERIEEMAEIWVGEV